MVDEEAPLLVLDIGGLVIGTECDDLLGGGRSVAVTYKGTSEDTTPLAHYTTRVGGIRPHNCLNS